jgi:hypothetical protein
MSGAGTLPSASLTDTGYAVGLMRRERLRLHRLPAMGTAASASTSNARTSAQRCPMKLLTSSCAVIWCSRISMNRCNARPWGGYFPACAMAGLWLSGDANPYPKVIGDWPPGMARKVLGYTGRRQRPSVTITRKVGQLRVSRVVCHLVNSHPPALAVFLLTTDLRFGECAYGIDVGARMGIGFQRPVTSATGQYQ